MFPVILRMDDATVIYGLLLFSYSDDLIRFFEGILMYLCEFANQFDFY